jgi:hypothetical protein
VDAYKFDLLMTQFKRKELGQDPLEWRYFLEFASSYFADRGIDRPVVVEIGIWNGLQRRFYEGLLGAKHIGIDNLKPFAPLTVKGPCSVPDIVGDSHQPATVQRLKVRLAGRPIDLLFVDGDHSYESVKKDYELYGPLTRHLVAFHDIFGVNPRDPGLGVYRFWNELAAEKAWPVVVFKKDSSADWTLQMGIGCIVKGA